MNFASAQILPIRATAPLFITVWNMPELTLARSGLRIDIRPGSLAREDYSDIISGLVGAQMIRKGAESLYSVAKAMTDAEIYDVFDGADRQVYRLSPAGWAFQRSMK